MLPYLVTVYYKPKLTPGMTNISLQPDAMRRAKRWAIVYCYLSCFNYPVIIGSESHYYYYRTYSGVK